MPKLTDADLAKRLTSFFRVLLNHNLPTAKIVHAITLSKHEAGGTVSEVHSVVQDQLAAELAGLLLK